VLRDQHGAFAVRAHPGVAVNGWGTTVYLHPFLSGVALTGSTIAEVAAGGYGAAVSASGDLRNAAEVLKGGWTVSRPLLGHRRPDRLSEDGRSGSPHRRGGGRAAFREAAKRRRPRPFGRRRSS